MRKEGNLLGKLILVVIVILMAVPQEAVADEIAELKAQLAVIMKRLERLEAKQAQKNVQIEKKIAAVEKKQVVSSQPPLKGQWWDDPAVKWIKNVKLSGDLRYRHEYSDDETKNSTRNRHRIRARLKIDAKVNDEVDLVFRLASGSSDSPTSTNQTLGESSPDSTGFSSKAIWLDWAYADWHPDWAPRLNIIMGKMPTLFYKAGKNQLIWDGDVAMEGIGAKYKFNLCENTDMHLNAGGFWVKEASGDEDISLVGAQGYLKHKLTSGNKLIGGASFYDYGNLRGNSLGGFSAKGNSTTGGIYDYDYNIFEAFVEYGFKVCDAPASVFGSYAKNMASGASENTGWLIGAKYNKAKAPGSWELSYDYRSIEPDAVVGGLNDSDFIGGGTNGSGHRIGGKYQISKNFQFGVTYFINEKNDNTTEDNFDLLQVDLIFKF